MVKVKMMGATKIWRLENSDWRIWLVIGVFILAACVKLNQRVQRLSASEQLGGHSGGFYGRDIKDEYAAPQMGEYGSSIWLPSISGLVIPIQHKLIKLTFRYRCVAECDNLWLSIPTIAESRPIRIILQHKLLREFRYPSVSGRGMTLFQRWINYQSVDEFLQNPPKSSTIYSEKSLVELYPSMGTKIRFLNDSTTNEVVPDYILTSYLKPRIFPNEWYEFGRIIDISEVERDREGYIHLEIDSSSKDALIDMTPPILELVE